VQLINLHQLLEEAAMKFGDVKREGIPLLLIVIFIPTLRTADV
jgi:hypothetical protein